MPFEKSNIDTVLADMRFLSETIGNRFAGTSGDRAGAEYIYKRFSETGLQPQLQRYQIMGWELHDEPQLKIPQADNRILTCFPFVYSCGTPSQGIEGTLRFGGRSELFDLQKFRPFEREKFKFKKFTIQDKKQQILAQIVSRDFPDGAKAAPWGAQNLPYTSPLVLISEQEGRMLERLLLANPEGIEVFLKYSTGFDPHAVSFNVIAHQPGFNSKYSDEALLIGAHYDTQYGTPGAADNASGVASLLSLASYFHEHPAKRALVFAAYGCEEIGYLGSRHHVETMKASGELQKIRFMLNLDMLSCNQPDWIHTTDDYLAQESARRAAREVGIFDKYNTVEFVTPPWPSGDQLPFEGAGIPCISLTWKGYKYPWIRLPKDTMEQVDEDVLSLSHRLAGMIVTQVDRML